MARSMLSLFQQIAFFPNWMEYFVCQWNIPFLDHIRRISRSLSPSLSAGFFFQVHRLRDDDHPQSTIHHINHNNRDTTRYTHIQYVWIEIRNWTALKYGLWDDAEDENNKSMNFLFEQTKITMLFAWICCMRISLMKYNQLNNANVIVCKRVLVVGNSMQPSRMTCQISLFYCDAQRRIGKCALPLGR